MPLARAGQVRFEDHGTWWRELVAVTAVLAATALLGLNTRILTKLALRDRVQVVFLRLRDQGHPPRRGLMCVGPPSGACRTFGNSYA